jgi:multidrug efflux pump subunit AcrB
MMNFILKRPIGVFMIGLVFLVLGLISAFKIPVSLLPNIPVPEIIVQVSYSGQSARNMETNVLRQLRNQLKQIAYVDEIESETKNGYGIIKLKFKYGVSTDLAFIEVNEKIDLAMNYLPRDLDRPRVTKGSSSDIPVFYLSISHKINQDPESFVSLSDFIFNVLKRRIEQLPGIAAADISGHLFAEIQIVPNHSKLQSIGYDQEVIVRAIQENNFDIGDLIIQEGIYQYNLKFSNTLQSIEDIENIRLNINKNIYKLKDLASVKKISEPLKGISSSQDRRSIQVAIIKQPDASVYEMGKTLDVFLNEIKSKYPDLHFEVHQDQTKLIKLSIDNLKSSLLLGCLLSILIIFIFMDDIKLLVIIGISVPLSLVISFFFMYVLKLSLNIISISGLILGVGMMIDNSIIVIDNISQKLKNGLDLFEACAIGTSEIISPLLSSALTTCAVFFPLVFLSGITGALFFDQALSIAIGLFSSLIVAVILIPSIFFQIKIKNKTTTIQNDFLTRCYIKGVCVFYQKKITILISLFFFISGLFFFYYLDFNRLPKLNEYEMRIKVDWNEELSVEDNFKRTQQLMYGIDEIKYVIESAEKKYLFQKNFSQSFSESEVFVSAKNPSHLNEVKIVLVR